MIIANGSSHTFRSNGNKGICFVELGNPKSKGFTGRDVRHSILKDGYSRGRFIERNGGKDDGKIKFKRD